MAAKELAPGRTAPVNPRKVTRNLFLRYLFAFSLIITMLVVSHGASLWSSQFSEAQSIAINVSGRQRMLSQRILYLGAELRLADQASAAQRAIDTGRRQDLETRYREAVDLFEQSHFALVQGSKKLGLAGLVTPALRDHYAGAAGAPGLHERTVQFIASARSLLSLTGADAERAWTQMTAAGPQVLLGELDQATRLFEAHAIALTRRMQMVETVSFLAAMLVLLLEAILIFWPAQRTVARSLTRLEGQNRRLKRARDRLHRFALAVRSANAATRSAKAQSTAKSRFLANMSHEMRTPLNGILGMIQMMERECLTPKQGEYVGIIKSSGQVLLSLISDILDLARIEEGRVDLVEERFCLRDLLQDVEQAVKGLAHQKGLDVVCRIDGEGPADCFIGDHRRIKQVLLNLAGNAVKFTEKGGVRIVARLEGGRIAFSVSDDGPGIPAEQQAAIFERFVQGDTSATCKAGGTGLGLSIASMLVGRMGGTLAVDSAKGEGATFHFTLALPEAPAVERLAPQGVSAEGEPPARAAEAKRVVRQVLAVDDNAINQTLIKHIVGTLDNVALCMAANGEEALEALEREPIDLVLMDIQMPVMSGDEAIRRIRASTQPYADVPIIVLTANAQQGAEDHYKALGADAYLIKPFQVEEMVRIILRMVRDGPDDPKGEPLLAAVG